MLIHGSCHCGNIAFRLRWEPAPSRIPVRTCNCSFCRKHGATWTANPAGSLEVSVRESGLVFKYLFGTQTSWFHVCRRCGIAPLATSKINGRLYAVVNANTFDDVEPSMLLSSPASFGDEDTATRLARRERSWIADVRFVGEQR